MSSRFDEHWSALAIEDWDLGPLGDRIQCRECREQLSDLEWKTLADVVAAADKGRAWRPANRPPKSRKIRAYRMAVSFLSKKHRGAEDKNAYIDVAAEERPPVTDRTVMRDFAYLKKEHPELWKAAEDWARRPTMSESGITSIRQLVLHPPTDTDKK